MEHHRLPALETGPSVLVRANQQTLGPGHDIAIPGSPDGTMRTIAPLTAPFQPHPPNPWPTSQLGGQQSRKLKKGTKERIIVTLVTVFANVKKINL